MMDGFREPNGFSNHMCICNCVRAWCDQLRCEMVLKKTKSNKVRLTNAMLDTLALFARHEKPTLTCMTHIHTQTQQLTFHLNFHEMIIHQIASHIHTYMHQSVSNFQNKINILIKFYLDMAVIAVDASERPSHFPYKISLNSVQSHPPIVPRMAKIIAVEVMKTMYTLKTRTAFSFSGLTLLPHACIQMFQIIHRSNYRFSSFFFCVLLLLLLVLAKDTLD